MTLSRVVRNVAAAGLFVTRIERALLECLGCGGDGVWKMVGVDLDWTGCMARKLRSCWLG
jgi:hypothetical protein